MKKRYISLLALIFSCYSFSAVTAQTRGDKTADSIKISATAAKNYVDGGLITVEAWRNTSAIFTLSGAELTRMNQANLLNTLQGRIPGLTVVSGSGEPGYDNPTLYMRGQSSYNTYGNGASVLIYLDGFQVDLGAISGLSAYEIESVSLLKDASALALYGLEGGAGVLSIQTKKGTAGGKTHIDFNARYGIMSPIKLPGSLNAFDYTTFYNQALSQDGLPRKYANPSLYKAANDPLHPNVNWYNQVLKKNSQIQDYNFSFRGGNTTAKYFVLMNYTDFQGLYKNADAIDPDFGTNAKYTKLNIRANVELQLNRNLSLTAGVSGITEDRNTPSGFPAYTLFNNLIALPAAAFPVKNPNGTWGNNAVYSFNPEQLLQTNGVYSSHTRSLLANFGFKQKLDKITKGLNLRGAISFGNQYAGIYQKQFTVPSYEITKDANDNPVLDGNNQIIYKKVGTISQSTNDGGGAHWNRTNIQAGFDYERTFGKSTFTGLLLGRKQAYTHDNTTYQVRTQGISGNLTYDYDKTYIVSLTASYDGSDDFAPGHRYGLFPAVGLGWIASNESFLKDNTVLTYLKIRASYGTVGNINENNRFLYQQFAQYAGGYTTGTSNNYQNGRTEGAIPNINASWEQKTTLNLGADLRLGKNLNATVDVFHTNGTGILEVPNTTVPAYTGFNLQYANSGQVSNKGIEASVNYNVTETAFKYYFGGSVAIARNKITRMAENVQPGSYLYNQGYSIGQQRGLIYKGFYQVSDFEADGTTLKAGVVKSSYANVRPGDLKYADQNGDGTINDYDKIPMNYTKIPQITLGFNFGFKYKGFDFDAYAQGVMHRTVNLLEDAFTYTHPFVGNNSITPFSVNSWTPATAATATTPRLSTLANLNNYQESDFWQRNGNFLKLRSIELGYTFPKTGLIQKIDAIRLFVSGTNLFTWGKIKGLEAENLSMGYPLTKVVSFGVKIKL